MSTYNCGNHCLGMCVYTEDERAGIFEKCYSDPSSADTCKNNSAIEILRQRRLESELEDPKSLNRR